MYKKMRNIVLIIFAVLLVFMVACARYQENLRTDEAQNSGQTAIDGDENAFREALKKDGKFFISGPLVGHTDTAKLDIAALPFNGPEAEKRKRVAERQLSGDYLYAAAEVCYMDKKTERVKTGKQIENKRTGKYEDEYKMETRLEAQPLHQTEAVATEATLFGVPVPLPTNIWLDKDMKIGGDTQHANEEVIRLKTVESGTIVWLEVEAKDGKIVAGSVKKADESQVHNLQRMAGTASFLPVLIGIPLLLLIPLLLILRFLRRRYDE